MCFLLYICWWTFKNRGAVWNNQMPITTDSSILQSCNIRFVLKMSSSLNNSVPIAIAMNPKFTIIKWRILNWTSLGSGLETCLWAIYQMGSKMAIIHRAERIISVSRPELEWRKLEMKKIWEKKMSRRRHTPSNYTYTAVIYCREEALNVRKYVESLAVMWLLHRLDQILRWCLGSTQCNEFVCASFS